jgi:Holliday junction resolvase RusA-like endonuclease
MLKLVVMGQPKPQPRHRHFKRGNFHGTYDPASDAKQSFLSVILSYAPEKPLDEPLCVDIDFYFARPKNHFGTGKNKDKLKLTAPNYHTTRPDIDNLRKFIMDAMNKVFWRDDSIICEGHTRKKYDIMPRTEIIVKTITEVMGV